MGSTYCYEWLFRYQDKISPGKLWDYITKDGTSKLLFDETTEKSYLYGLLISMVQTSTVRTPALIKGDWKDYTIVCDEKTLHYGAPGYEHPPPQHYVRCITRTNLQTK
jgi:hypothetical protein